MSITQLIFRFVIGGSVVVSVSLLAQFAGTGLAGRFMTIPALTALSLLFLYLNKGPEVAGSVAKAGLIGLLPVAAYLIVAAWSFERNMPLGASFALSIGTWAVGVVILQYVHISTLQWAIGLVSLRLVMIAKSHFSRSWLVETTPQGELVPTYAALTVCVIAIGGMTTSVVILAGGSWSTAINAFAWSIIALFICILIRKEIRSFKQPTTMLEQ